MIEVEQRPETRRYFFEYELADPKNPRREICESDEYVALLALAPRAKEQWFGYAPYVLVKAETPWAAAEQALRRWLAEDLPPVAIERMGIRGDLSHASIRGRGRHPPGGDVQPPGRLALPHQGQRFR